MVTMGERKEKICSIDEAIEQIRDGFTIGLSGIPLCQEPMALIRALIKKGVKDITTVVLAGGIGSDMLIGAGCVKKVVSLSMGLQNYAPIAPNFRKAVEEGKIEVWEGDFQHWHMALKASAWNLPYLYTKAGIGTDLPRVNPNLKEINIDGEPYLTVPPISLDACLLYASQADPYGNAIYKGTVVWEHELARATRGPIIVVAEELIPNDFIRRDPRIVTLCGEIAADYVVEIPYGAHPCEGQGYYIHDAEHVKEYVAAAEAARKGQDPEAFQKYLKKYIFTPQSHGEYLEAIGGITRLLKLRQSLL